MSASLTPKEYCCVIQLVNQYYVMHVRKNKKRFVSDALKDKKTAQVAVENFAKTHDIDYRIDYREQADPQQQPVMATAAHGSSWCPAELYPDRISVMTSSGSFSLEHENLWHAQAVTKDIAARSEYCYLDKTF